MVRWAEKYPEAIPDVLDLVEPVKYKNAMFEAVRILAPLGDLIFPAEDPKDDVLLIPNEETGEDEPRKLGRFEKESLMQMRLMLEEMCLIVRSKNKTTGRVSYGLPPEWARKVHDDRAYVMAMAAWGIKNEQEKTELGEPKGLDYSSYGSSHLEGDKKKTEKPENNAWLNKMSSNTRNTRRSVSPFSGKSPFVNK